MKDKISQVVSSYENSLLIYEERIQSSIEYVLKKLEENLKVFTDKFPCAASEILIYYPIKNTGFDTSFWTGMLWLAYDITGDQKYRTAAEVQLKSFQERLENNIEIDCMNIGRLYILSCVAAYKITRNSIARDLALKAADKLAERFIEKGKFILGWGRINDLRDGGLELPSLIDLSLLYWASLETGNKRYHNIAEQHLNQVVKYNIRENGSTFHQFYIDIDTGEPLYAGNITGYSDQSCWSRGHALGIYNLSINYIYTGDVNLLQKAKKMADYFISRLPEDGICYWDLVFSEGEEPRDTSAAAIAVCGLLELSRYLPLIDKDKYIYENTAIKILVNLMKDYTTNTEEYSDSNGILMGGVYRKPFSYGENECLLIGEYFYFEALIKASRCFRSYW